MSTEIEVNKCFLITLGPHGDLRKLLYIFRELRSTGCYFKGAGEQAHNLGD